MILAKRTKYLIIIASLLKQVKKWKKQLS